MRPIECFRSNRYEPYVVVSMSQMPLYDERFAGAHPASFRVDPYAIEQRTHLPSQ